MKQHNTLKLFILVLGDIAMLYFALFLSLFIRYYPAPESILLREHYLPFSVMFFIWLLMFGAMGLYDFRFVKNSKRFLYRLLRAIATNTVISIIIFYLLPFWEIEPRRNLLLIAVISTILIFLWRWVFNLSVLKTLYARVLFFGANSEVIELADYLLKNPQLGQKPVAFLATEGDLNAAAPPLPLFTSAPDLPHLVQDFNIETIVMLREVKEKKENVNALFGTLSFGPAIMEFNSFYEMTTGKIPLSRIQQVWFLENLIGMRKRFYEFFKRLLDLLCGAIIGIPAVLLFPFMTLAIKLESPGPVFFRQKRVGKNGKIFEFIKYRSTFRTKVDENTGWGKEEKNIYTKVGSFLRKTYLDELPQIINVFRGEMSLVGPRPERPEFVAELKKQVPFYKIRLLVLPGLTGWAQVNMENDAAAQDAPEKMQYDLYYIKNRSPILDFLIMLKTLFVLIQRSGR